MSYYATRQFVKAIEKLRERLEATSKQEVEAIRQSEKATRDNKQDPLPTPLRVLAENYTEHAEKKEQDEQQRKSHRIQIWIAIATSLAFIAAAYYASIARSQAVDMHAATEASIKAVQEARISLEISQNQFDRTMHQIVNQTVAQADAAKAARDASRIAKNALEAQAIEFESQHPPAQIAIDPYVSWYYQSPKNSPPCKMGFVCALLFIHNLAPNSAATGVEVATRISMLSIAPKDYPQNWRPISPSTTIQYSPQATSGTYPSCTECGQFLAAKAINPKVGTLYVWGTVRYRRYSSGPTKNVSFCFSMPSGLVFPRGPNGFGAEGKQYQCQDR